MGMKGKVLAVLAGAAVVATVAVTAASGATRAEPGITSNSILIGGTFPLTGVASLVGLVLVINYGLATQWMSQGQQGFHIVLTALMIAFFFARAGRTLGLDAWLWSVRPKSLFARAWASWAISLAALSSAGVSMKPAASLL